MKVLVSAVPATGHVVPLLDIARSLGAAGHDVRFATNGQSHRLIEQAGLHHVSAGMDTVHMVAERRRRWPQTDAQPATVWATRMWARVMAPSALPDLLRLVAEWRPDIVIHDEGEYAGPVAAAHAGIPWVTHTWGSPLRPTNEIDELEEHAEELWHSVGLDIPPAAGLYAHATINPCPTRLQPDGDGVGVVWPMRPRPFEGTGVQLRADAYVGFGTVPIFATAPAELESAVRACTARGMSVVVTAPTENLRDQLTSISPDLVQAHEFVSLPSLIASCAVVITHAGAGTVLSSLTAGVPLVLVPRGSPSQVRMAAACDRANVGRQCDASGIADALAGVLDQELITHTAKAVAGEISMMPSSSEVVASIQELATT